MKILLCCETTRFWQSVKICQARYASFYGPFCGSTHPPHSLENNDYY